MYHVMNHPSRDFNIFGLRQPVRLARRDAIKKPKPGPEGEASSSSAVKAEPVKSEGGAVQMPPVRRGAFQPKSKFFNVDRRTEEKKAADERVRLRSVRLTWFCSPGTFFFIFCY